MNDNFEILKYVLPALIIIIPVYFLFTNFMKQQYRMKILDHQQGEGNSLLPLRFQSCERLMLMLERMEPSSMFLRLNTGSLNSSQMRDMMLITVNQEFEYNLAQQLYISDDLWKIIVLAKDQTANLILKCSEGVIDTDPSTVLISRYDALISQIKSSPLDTARSALKKELQTYI